MKNKIILKTLILFAFIQCTAQLSNSRLIENNNLIIEGDNIWIREYPSTGDVILKLNSGEICKVLKKDKKEVINGISDFWYKIDYKGKIGWVFGSQTSIKQDSIKLSGKVNKERVFLPLKDYDIRYEKGLNIKIIDKVVREGDESEVKILFEYKYSEKKPSLVFVSEQRVPDSPQIYIYEKTMDLNELQKKIKVSFNFSMKKDQKGENLVFLGGFEYNNVLLTKKEIFADTGFITSIQTTLIYNFDKNGNISEVPQSEYYINEKTIAQESFDFFESKSLKKIKGTISKNENITIISSPEYSYNGGLFKIRSEKGVIGWIHIELYRDPRRDKPQLEGVFSYDW